MKVMMDEEELRGINMEVSRIREEVGDLVEELRGSRRRLEQLRGSLAEEGSSMGAMEKNLMAQVAEEEERGWWRLEEQLRQEARVGQASSRLLEAASRPGAAHTEEEQERQEAKVVPSSWPYMSESGLIPHKFEPKLPPIFS